MNEQDSKAKPDNAEYSKRLDELKAHLDMAHLFVEKVHEHRQSYYEKLILLDSANLTVLLTAISSIASSGRGRSLFDQQSHRLSVGLWMLIASIICCLLHNQLNNAFFIHASSQRLITSLTSSRDLLARAAVLGGLDLGLPPLPANLGKEKVDKATRSMTFAEKGSLILGACAQILTIWAYVEFARAIIAAL
jgi:hypothetical protein